MSTNTAILQFKAMKLNCTHCNHRADINPVSRQQHHKTVGLYLDFDVSEYLYLNIRMTDSLGIHSPSEHQPSHLHVGAVLPLRVDRCQEDISGWEKRRQRIFPSLFCSEGATQIDTVITERRKKRPLTWKKL